MVNVSVARRYARALIEVAAESGSLDRIAEQLDAFVSTMRSSAELGDVLVNPAYTRSQRTAVTESVMQFVGPLDPALQNLLRLLVDRHRMSYLPDISRLFRDMADTRAGRVRGKVTSAVQLPDEALRRLERALATVTQRNVVLEAQVDPSILGGVSAQVGSVVYDGSIKSQLTNMRRTLSER